MSNTRIVFYKSNTDWEKNIPDGRDVGRILPAGLGTPGNRSAGVAGPTDLTEKEWERIEPLLPKLSRQGRKPAVDLREVLNAFRYKAPSAGG